MLKRRASVEFEGWMLVPVGIVIILGSLFFPHQLTVPGSTVTTYVSFSCVTLAQAETLIANGGGANEDTSCPAYATAIADGVNPSTVADFSGSYAVTTTTTSTTTSSALTMTGVQPLAVVIPIDPTADNTAPVNVAVEGCNASPSPISSDQITAVTVSTGCAPTLVLPQGYTWTGSGTQNWVIAGCASSSCPAQVPNYVGPQASQTTQTSMSATTVIVTSTSLTTTTQTTTIAGVVTTVTQTLTSVTASCMSSCGVGPPWSYLLNIGTDLGVAVVLIGLFLWRREE